MTLTLARVCPYCTCNLMAEWEQAPTVAARHVLMCQMLTGMCSGCQRVECAKQSTACELIAAVDQIRQEGGHVARGPHWRWLLEAVCRYDALRLPRAGVQ